MPCDPRLSKVDFGGVTREACMDYVPDARLGDYVLVHVGFAISKVDEEEARRIDLHRGDLAESCSLGYRPMCRFDSYYIWRCVA